MVRFGDTLVGHAEEFSGMITEDVYIDYMKLKDVLYENPANFLDEFIRELQKMSHFIHKRAEPEKRICGEGCPCQLPAQQARAKFIEVNREGCRKILKKFDKNTGAGCLQTYMPLVDRVIDDATALDSIPPPPPLAELRKVNRADNQAMHTTPPETPKSRKDPVIWSTHGGVRLGCLHRLAKVNKRGKVLTVVRGGHHGGDGEGETIPHDYFLVHDPENKARYVIPSVLIDDTSGKASYPTKPQSFICMLFQKGQPGSTRCNAHRSCNQLHINHQAVKFLRQLCTTSRGYSISTTENFIVELKGVLDPVSSKPLTIPYHMTVATAGRGTAACPEGAGEQSQLCTYHLDGWCRHGRKCRDIHADPAYVRKIRTGNPCCPAHDPSVQPVNVDPALKTYVRQMETSLPVSNDLLSTTKGLTSLLGNGKTVCVFSIGKICRLHQENRCTFGFSCNNIHVCRTFAQDLPAKFTAASSVAASAAPPPLSAPSGPPPLEEPRPTAADGEPTSPTALSLSIQQLLQASASDPTQFPTSIPSSFPSLVFSPWPTTEPPRVA